MRREGRKRGEEEDSIVAHQSIHSNFLCPRVFLMKRSRAGSPLASSSSSSSSTPSFFYFNIASAPSSITTRRDGAPAARQKGFSLSFSSFSNEHGLISFPVASRNHLLLLFTTRVTNKKKKKKKRWIKKSVLLAIGNQTEECVDPLKWSRVFVLVVPCSLSLPEEGNGRQSQ